MPNSNNLVTESNIKTLKEKLFAIHANKFTYADEHIKTALERLAEAKEDNSFELLYLAGKEYFFHDLCTWYLALESQEQDEKLLPLLYFGRIFYGFEKTRSRSDSSVEKKEELSIKKQHFREKYAHDIDITKVNHECKDLMLTFNGPIEFYNELIKLPSHSFITLPKISENAQEKAKQMAIIHALFTLSFTPEDRELISHIEALKQQTPFEQIEEFVLYYYNLRANQQDEKREFREFIAVVHTIEQNRINDLPIDFKSFDDAFEKVKNIISPHCDRLLQNDINNLKFKQKIFDVLLNMTALAIITTISLLIASCFTLAISSTILGTAALGSVCLFIITRLTKDSFFDEPLKQLEQLEQVAQIEQNEKLCTINFFMNYRNTTPRFFPSAPPNEPYVTPGNTPIASPSQ